MISCRGLINAFTKPPQNSQEAKKPDSPGSVRAGRDYLKQAAAGKEGSRGERHEYRRVVRELDGDRRDP